MRGFILRLQHFSSTLRTNSKQALRKHRKTDSSSFQHDILDQGAVPLRKTGSQVPEAKKSFPEPSWGLPSTSGPKSFSLSLSLSFFFLDCISFFGVVIIIFLFYFIFKFYIIVLVLPNIKMNPPQVYMCSPS